MTEKTGFSIWRNYKENKVGVEIDGQGRLLMDPDTAREKADRMEESLDQLPEHFRDQQRDIIQTIREFADDVEE